MKILQLGKYYPPHFGGIESVTYDLTEGLNARGYPCDVLCFNENGTSIEEAHQGFKVIRASRSAEFSSTAFSLSMPLLLNRLKDRYDIIHVHLPNPMAALAVFLCRPEAKVILHWHSDIIRQRVIYPFFSPLEQWLLRRATKVISTSPSYVEGSGNLQRFRDKVKVIPIGISRERLSVQLDKVSQIRDRYRGKKIVFSLGRLIYYKGFEYLIRTARHLDDNAIVLIGGEGPLGPQLANMIAAEGVQEKVTLLGRVNETDLGNYFMASDIFCLPSIERSEAFGVVLLEALQFGKPIVATRIFGSGVSWVNLHDVTGFNVPIRNAEMLAENINALMSDRDRYDRFSKNALSRFQECFTSDKMVDSFIELYSDILK
jgi:glycosyltransferase involved in cell wall biosynthesis